MRQRLLQHLSFAKPLRLALVLFTLLLTLPQTAMGETVTKTITLNKSVSETNFPEGQNLTLGSITLPVTITENSITYDGQITIESASISSYSSDTNGAVFKMKGSNASNSQFHLEVPGNYPAIPSQVTVETAYANASENGAYFSVELDGSLDPGNTYDYKSTSTSLPNTTVTFTADGNPRTNRSSEGTFDIWFTIGANWDLTTQTQTTVTVKEITITYERDTYGLTIGNTVVKSDNRTDVLGDGKVSYVHDATNNSGTLTLNGASITSTSTPTIDSSLGSLTVKLAGTNTINCGSNNAFNLAANSGLNFTADGTSPGQLTISSTNSITTESFYSPSTATVTYTGLVASNPTSTSVLISPPTSYDITIAGVAVTNANAAAITGTGISGNVSYDATTNTLTLNGATIDGSGGITYNGNSLLTIALNGSNSVSTTNAAGTVAFYLNGGTIKFIKATGANSAELTATCGSGGSPIDTNVSTLGSGLYWKPIARETMVITEDPNFLILDGVVIPDGTTINGTSGSLIYNASDKTLTLNGYEKDFGTRHAIKTGVLGLKVKLIGASTINCYADSAVFHAFSSSASIQFIKDDPTSKLTMTGTDFNNFATNSITYDGLFHYSDNTNKIITQAAAPELGKLTKVDAGSYYTFATIDYADSDKSGTTVIYSAAGPALKYSFDYADSQKQDVSNQTYPAEGIKMTDPGILTAWVEVGTYKGPEAKGVRFGFIENPIEMEFNGTSKEISITPAPTMTNAVTPSVNNDYTTSFNSFATLDATNNKITINSCYDGMIGFTFTNTDVGYTSLNDTTKITFNVTPPKPTISVPGGTYDAAQTVSIVSNYQGTGATIKYYFDPTAEQTYSADLSITETKTLTAWVEVNGVKSDTVQAPYTIRQAANLSYSATSATANIHESSITFTPPTLSNPSQVAVTYSSSNTAVATINTTGDVTIVGAGVTTISAKPTDETLYIPTPATYELTVTRDFNNPFANQPAEQIYATYFNVYEDLTLPDGIAAYVITGISGNTVTTTATGYLPHEVPVLLEKTGNVGTTITGYTGSAGNFSGNLLKYADQTFSSTGKEYVLYMNEFVKATGNIPDSKCYLDLSSVNPSRGMYGIGDGSTSIRELRMENEGRDEWYDLQGRRIEQPTKAGLYIKNGKKVIVNIK